MRTWMRSDLKQRAKDVLRVNYWVAFVVALILAVVSGGSGGSGGSSGHQGAEYRIDAPWDYNGRFEINDGFVFEQSREALAEIEEFFVRTMPAVIPIVISTLAAVILFALALRILLFNQLEVGCRRFFKTAAEEPHKNMRHLGIAFKDGNYGPILKTMFLRGLYTFLWSLLFVIPGIIKAYAYRMVPYILADNPKMDSEQAILLSRQMMMGEKWRTFVLDLSFIGWYLLGALACGIGVLFVNPYAFSTDAQLYLVLRNKAINGSYCTPQQLNMQPSA